ncbi:alpha/beta hydrolase family protein [Phenylobacterium kunshanense]|uniref:S9 family peptidase n=1 Tax=Phenylobacterium kunshanense TaxID=1445034 RepID=A0A328BG03_9CAUL|nr:S9 family peptidase [Phenylobacterium kunshanense]RAK65549.1 S9 family peptidase [Phenylobacterium kunshanense]
MRFVRWAAGLVAALGLFTCATAAPLEAYGGLPSIERIEISPDGTLLAVAISNGEQRLLGVRPIAGGEMTLRAVGAAKVRRLDWVGNDNLIVSTSRTAQILGMTGDRSEYMMGYRYNLPSQKVFPLLQGSISQGGSGTNIRDRNENLGASLNVLAGPPRVHMINGAPTLFLPGITFPQNWGTLTYFRMNLKTDRPELLEVGTRHTVRMVLDEGGQVIAKADWETESGRWTLRLRDGAGWPVAHAVVAKISPPFLAGLGRDGKSVVVGEDGEKGMTFREISTAGWGETLPIDNADGLIVDPATSRLIGYHALVGDEDRYTFFDPRDQAAWNGVRNAFKGDRVTLESWSQDRKKIVVLADSPTEGPAYALVDLTTKRAEWLGGRYQKLSAEDIAPVQAIRFKAADGLDLSGYLTTPQGRAPKGLPLIVFPHGGPAARDEPGFDWWAQAMASRGYAVLQVNFRGSDGLGLSHLEAGYGQWGKKMQTDLSDGVRHLIGQGVVDPKRVCIVGASYGGYAALAGAALDRGIYRCAVSVAGVSDLRRMVDDEGKAAQRYWKRFMGVTSLNDPALAEVSPALQASKIDIPILIIHGRDDTVVPLEQSQIMADALKKAGKPYELIVQKGEDHWLSRGETRSEMLAATMAFVEKHNPPN